MKRIFLLITLLFLLVIGGGVFGLVWYRDEPATVRDWVLIIFFSVGILVALVTLLATVAIAIAAIALLGTANRLMQEKVVPLADSARETVESIRGTAEFMGDRAVKPVIKTYSFFSGAKRAAGVITGFGGRKG